MAFELKAPGPNAGRAYNVEQAVGKNSPNASGDVKLVQYMLRNIYGQSASGLAVDGFAGPVTVSWIQKFQNDQKAQGQNVLADGRVDRAFGKLSTVSKTTYSILLMNEALRKHNPSAFGALPNQVPLSPSPKTNPYNPAKPPAKVVKSYTVIALPGGKKKVTYTYADGSTETVIIAGNVVVDGQVITPTVILIRSSVVVSPPLMHHIFEYSDGSVKIHVTPLDWGP